MKAFFLLDEIGVKRGDRNGSEKGAIALSGQESSFSSGKEDKKRPKMGRQLIA